MVTNLCREPQRSRVIDACCVCRLAGCLLCPWPWSRPKLARSWSPLREEAVSCSAWPSAARSCHSSSPTCCTRRESWRSGNAADVLFRTEAVRCFSHSLALPFSGTVRPYPSSGTRSFWVRISIRFILWCTTFRVQLLPLSFRAVHVAAARPHSHRVQTGHGGQRDSW